MHLCQCRHPQRCISLQDWKVCSPLEASGLTFHKLQSCFPFLLIFSFQRSFTTHTHTHKTGEGDGSCLIPRLANHSHSINDANLHTYHKDIFIYSRCTHLKKAPFFRSAHVWTSRLREQVWATSLHVYFAIEVTRLSALKVGAWAGHLHPCTKAAKFQPPALDKEQLQQSCSGGSYRWFFFFLGEQKRLRYRAVMNRYLKRDPKGDWGTEPVAPVWPGGGLWQGMLDPRKPTFAWAAFGWREHRLYTQIWNLSTNG